MGKIDFFLADLHFCLDIPFDMDITKESNSFMLSDFDNIDEYVRFIPVDDIGEMLPGGYWYNLRYYVRTKEGYNIYFCYVQSLEPYALVEYLSDGIRFYYVPSSSEIEYKSYCIVNMLSLEYLLLRHRGLLLHASFIRWKDKGILFSAPSGTGKSTQANLWMKYMGADILNGDRACIRKVEGCWKAYGLPYAGSSGIYRNESAELDRIVILQQGKENRIRPLNVGESIQLLMSELSVHFWDSIYLNEVMDIVMEILEKIPVYLMICRPDYDAVEVLYNSMIDKVGDE